MNILFLVILTVLLVAVLAFLTPWISKTIEEPFQASTCLAPGTTTPVLFPQGPSASWRDYVEEGKQRYNFFGLLQGNAERRAFEAPSALGSIDPVRAAGQSQSPLEKLNANIRAALETVDVVPKQMGPLVDPLVSIVKAPAATLVNGQSTIVPRTQISVSNSSEVLNSQYIDGQFGSVVSYVEERLPAKDSNLADAAKCEVTNMWYRLNAASTSDADLAEARGLHINRHQLCDLLAESSQETTIRNAFPNNPDKKCGICLKEATPKNDPRVFNKDNRAYNNIGGLYVSQGDINTANNRSLTDPQYYPTHGSCAPGYFFIPKTGNDAVEEVRKCKEAADRLACDEIATTGGFVGGKSKDFKDVSGSNCYACIKPAGNQFAYYRAPPPEGQKQSIRVRIVVPTGTGRTRVKFTVVGGEEFTYKLTARKTGTTNITSSEGGTDYINNMFYFNISANPNDLVRITAYQEFPHRPRGLAEVFFVKFPTDYSSKDMSGAVILASSIDCTVATETQLREAQARGMQVCEPGWADVSGVYVVRKDAVGTNNFATGDETGKCNILRDKGGVIKTTEPAQGVWCYGIKPTEEYLENVTETNGFTKPNVANFYSYYTQVDEEGKVSPAEKKAIASSISTSLNDRPQYRGIIVQFERNNTASINGQETINVGIEDYMTKADTTDLTALNPNTLSNRMRHYSRNGRFSDSLRLITPKPDATNNDDVYKVINSNIYWLWGTDHKRQKFEMEVQVPGYFQQPTYPADIDKCAGGSGVLHSAQKYLDRVRVPACSAGMDESDSTGCLAHLFAAAGGSLDYGTLSPQATNADTGLKNRKYLLYKDYDAQNLSKSLTQKRSEAEIKTLLRRLMDIAKGTDSSLASLSDTEKREKMNDASRKLLGKDAIGPCEEILVGNEFDMNGAQIVLKSGPLDAQCLDFLYRNTIADSNRQTDALRSSTYSNIGDRFSGLDYPGGEYRTATDSEISANPYKACQPKGKWAPLVNGQPNSLAVAEINAEINADRTNVNSVTKAIRIFNELHQNANSTGSEQAKALERCYGVKKREYITNCSGIRANTLFIYDMSGVLIGGKYASIVAKDSSTNPSSVTIAEVQRPISVFTVDSFIASDINTVVSTNPMYGIRKNEYLKSLFIQYAEMKGANIVGQTGNVVTHIAKDTVGDGKVSFILAIIEKASATDATEKTKMVELEFTIDGGELKVRAKAAKFGAANITSSSGLLSVWNAKESINMNVATTATRSGFGITNLRVGFESKRYTGVTWDATEEEILGNPSTISSETNACMRRSANTAIKDLSNPRIYQYKLGENNQDTNFRIRGVNLNQKGCGLNWCCAAYEPYFTLPEDSNIGAVEIIKSIGYPTSASSTVLVIAKDLSGVVAQKMIALPSSGPGIARFQQEDVRPLISYTEISGGKALVGTTNLRFESAIGERFFLEKGGKISQLAEAATDTNTSTPVSDTKFTLVQQVSSNIIVTSNSIYSIREFNNPSRYLQKGYDNDSVKTDTKKINADWNIEPAINGAYAYISLQLVNMPGYYLVAEKNGDTYKAVAKVVDPNNDVECFFACWRMYPVQ